VVIARQLATPWAPHTGLYSLPGSLTLKLRLGEAPEHVPAQLDVRRRAGSPATALDGGVIDRLVRHYANGAHITRVFAASASLGRRGEMHRDLSDDEHICGLSRTFRLDIDKGSPIEQIVAALSEVSTVEHASPNYVSRVPFSAAPAFEQTIDLDEAWASRD